jgi:hypothetical protein
MSAPPVKTPLTRPVTLKRADRLQPPTKAQLKARAQMKESADAVRLRKLDTRGKIILGGALLDLASFGSEDAVRVFEKIVKEMPRDADAATIRQIRKFWAV